MRPFNHMGLYEVVEDRLVEGSSVGFDVVDGEIVVNIA